MLLNLTGEKLSKSFGQINSFAAKNVRYIIDFYYFVSSFNNWWSC